MGHQFSLQASPKPSAPGVRTRNPLHSQSPCCLWPVDHIYSTAAKLDNHPLIRWFLSHGADPSVPAHHNGATTLTLAAASSTVETMKLLIDADAGGDVRKGSPLVVAAASSNSGRLSMARYLVAIGASLNALQHEDDESRFKTFSSTGLGTALHATVRWDRREMCALLLELGVDKTVKDTLGRTPLDLAREMGRWEVGRLLLDEQGELVEASERKEELNYEREVEGREEESEDEDDEEDIEWETDDGAEPEVVSEGQSALTSQMQFEEGKALLGSCNVLIFFLL